MPTAFTPVSALIGGALIGLAATLLYATLGRIAGISGIVNAAVDARADRGWRIAFLLGLVAAASAWLFGAGVAPRAGFPLPWLVAAGLLVGVAGGREATQGIAVAAKVPAIAMPGGADQGEAMGLLSHVRQQSAQVRARHGRADRVEDRTVFGSRVRLGIKGLVLAGTTAQEEQDAGLGAGGGLCGGVAGGGGVGLEEGGQPETEGAQTADTHELTAVQQVIP